MSVRCLNLFVAPSVMLALVCAALWAPAAGAATFTVNNTTDAIGSCPTPATCSLRQAIADADTLAGSDAIEFNLPSGAVISLTQGTLLVVPANPGDALAIRGPADGALTVRRDPTAPPSSVFGIFTGRGATLSRFTISGGLGGPFQGAAMNTLVPLVLDRMVITQNTGDAGGAGASAGLVLNAPATIRGSTLHANTVLNSGGGQSSGAIVNLGELLVVNSTIAANTVTGPGPDDGGAIVNFGGVTLLNSTVSGNTAVGGAGGILGLGVGMANSIVAGNTATPSPDCDGTIESQGYNIVGSPTGCTVTAAPGDQVGTAATPLNPLLGPLAPNGGLTPTMALLVASPARDAGNPAAVSDLPPPLPPDLVPCATTDQRGSARPGGARCDIGAFEVVPPPPVVPIPPPPPLPPPLPPFVAPPVDHFKCYAAKQTGFRGRSVRLRDQFATRTARLRGTTSVCNPARKNGSRVLEPKAHLVCYQSRDAAPFSARRVSVTNQFGTRVLRVVRPVSLCVPSLKRKGRQVPGIAPTLERRLDHFRCYAVDPKLTPRNVTTSDQFVTTRTTVVSVVRLCNPVSKNGGAVRKPAAHLVCYSIRDVAASKVRAVTVRNQFGIARLSVGKARSLCLPSLKTDLPSATAPRSWRALR